MAERKQAHNDKELYAFMKAYQLKYGVPPTLEEIVIIHKKFNHRSSAWYGIHRLIERGLVIETKTQTSKRRYLAVE